jgi:hypothetical protein
MEKTSDRYDFHSSGVGGHCWVFRADIMNTMKHTFGTWGSSIGVIVERF